MARNTPSESGSPPAWEHRECTVVEEFALFRVRREVVRSPRDESDLTFDIAESEDGVAVIARTRAGELVLVEQYRPPVRRNFLELPAGIVDEGEDPLGAGMRELREETGFTGSNPRYLGAFLLNPSWQTTRVHLIVCDDAQRTGARDLDEGEDTRVRVVPSARLDGLIREGALDNAVALAAIATLRAHGW
jgi:ADP-ribose pyrophosphatase